MQEVHPSVNIVRRGTLVLSVGHITLGRHQNTTAVLPTVSCIVTLLTGGCSSTMFMSYLMVPQAWSASGDCGRSGSSWVWVPALTLARELIWCNPKCSVNPTGEDVVEGVPVPGISWPERLSSRRTTICASRSESRRSRRWCRPRMLVWAATWYSRCPPICGDRT